MRDSNSRGVAPNTLSKSAELGPGQFGAVCDLRRNEATTGVIRWRLPIGEPFHQPVLAEERVLITTAAGNLIEVDANSGASSRRLVMPQKLSVPVAFDRSTSGQRYYQLGEHSTLFVRAAGADAAAAVSEVVGLVTRDFDEAGHGA